MGKLSPPLLFPGNPRPLDFLSQIWYDFLYLSIAFIKETCVMERIKTLQTRDMCESAKNGGCGECQTSCQSACKTSCGVANQKCENAGK